MKKRISFQQQVMRAFLPATILVILFSGLMLYLLGSSQVKKNSRYLITNTTRQTANIVDDKLELVLGKCSELNKTLALWRLVTHPYTEETKTREYEDMISVHKYLQDIYNDSNGAIDSIAFQTVFANRLNVYYDMVYQYSELKEENFHTDNGNKIAWLNVHEDQVFSTRIPREVLSLVIPYKNSKGADTGILVINFKAEYFRDLLNEAEISRNGYVFLLSDDGVLMPADMKEQYRLEAEQLDDLRVLEASGDYQLKLEGAKGAFDIHYTPLNSNGWRVVSVTPYADLFSTLDNFKVLFAMILVAAGVFSFLVSIFCSKYISRPIKRLSEQVVEFEYNRDIRFDVDAGEEINTLAGGLNHLKETIDELLVQVMEEQKQKSQLELLILQAQIKPHFLYNTLGSIKSLSDLQDSARASSMCDALIQFYRISLSNGNSVITVGMEIELVDHYLNILEYRYGNKFEYSFEVDDAVRHIDIPRMSLQPLVENAVYHGLKPKEGKGILVISGEFCDEFMILTVFDDGVGMSAEEVSRLREDIRREEIASGKQGGFALRNVYMRLKGFYGEQVEFKIDSVKDIYTQVQVKVPLGAVKEITDVQADDCR